MMFSFQRYPRLEAFISVLYYRRPFKTTLRGSAVISISAVAANFLTITFKMHHFRQVKWDHLFRELICVTYTGCPQELLTISPDFKSVNLHKICLIMVAVNIYELGSTAAWDT